MDRPSNDFLCHSDSAGLSSSDSVNPYRMADACYMRINMHVQLCNVLYYCRSFLRSACFVLLQVVLAVSLFCITAGRSCGQPGGGWLKHSLMTLCTAQKAHPLKCRATHTGWLTTWIRVMNISLKFLRYSIVVFFNLLVLCGVRPIIIS